MNSKTERVQKVLAQAGVGSRRQIESWIQEGRIHINGQLAKLGDHIGDHDKITIDSKPVRFKTNTPAKLRVLIYNKPEGQICTRLDPEGRATVFEHLPRLAQGRWVAVGRLDINSSGLLLFTNDGELANRLMHPSSAVEREYAVRVFGEVTKETLQKLQQGVMLEDGMARFDSVMDAGGEGLNHWYNVVIKEGRKREVRRLWESQGFKVSRLIRIRFGPVVLPRALHLGQSADLDAKDLEQLMNLAGYTPPKEKNQSKIPRRRPALGINRQKPSRQKPGRNK